MIKNGTLACISKAAAVALFRTVSKNFLENLKKTTKNRSRQEGYQTRSLTEEGYGKKTFWCNILLLVVLNKKARLALILC
jgi:hypothetical protein